MRNGKVALITGGGSGIGRAVALAMHGAGYDVMITGRRAPALAGTVAMALQSDARIASFAANVSEPAAVQALFDENQKTFGRIDVLFNNAGLSAPAVPFDEIPYEAWSTVVATNLTGAFLCAQQAFRRMKAQQPSGGRIINNGSISAHVPRPNSAPYTATKHAITGLTRSLSLDGRAWNIACGQIDIGNAASEMTARMASGILQANGTVMTEPRMDVKHVADAVLYMAGLPLDANVEFMTVMATKMPFIGRG